MSDVQTGLLLLLTAYLFDQGALNATTMPACWCVVLFSTLVSTGKVPDTVLAFSIGASDAAPRLQEAWAAC